MERLKVKWFYERITVSRQELEEYKRRQALLAWVCPVCNRVWMRSNEIDISFWVGEQWLNKAGEVIISSHRDKAGEHCEGGVQLIERPDAQAAFLIGGPEAVEDLGE